MLRAGRNTKMSKNEDENKDVIHAQRILDQITGKKIQPMMWSFDPPHQCIKSKREEHPEHAASRRSSHAEFSISAMEGEEIDPDRDEHAYVKGDPKPDARPHRGEIFMHSGARQW